MATKVSQKLARLRWGAGGVVAIGAAYAYAWKIAYTADEATALAVKIAWYRQDTYNYWTDVAKGFERKEKELHKKHIDPKCAECARDCGLQQCLDSVHAAECAVLKNARDVAMKRAENMHTEARSQAQMLKMRWILSRLTGKSTPEANKIVRDLW